MPHDKIRAAARQRMAETGEPYTAARRAVIGEQQDDYPDCRPAGAGCPLRMSGEIHGWLAGLQATDAPRALRVVKALADLMREGLSLGEPVVTSTADGWPWALRVALERSHQERLDQLTLLRRGVADADALIRDIRDHLADLEAAWASLEDARRQALEAGRPQEAARAAAELAAIGQQAAEAGRLLPRMAEAQAQMGERSQRLQARAEAARARAEGLKAGLAAARGGLQAREAMAALGLADDDASRNPESSQEAISAAQARIADIVSQMERELGYSDRRPEGLMQLQPGAPWHSDIRILFAAEPPGSALLIAVLEGRDAVREQYPDAVMASADLLRRFRAGEAPEAAAHAYYHPRSFLEEFYPSAASDPENDVAPQ